MRNKVCNNVTSSVRNAAPVPALPDPTRPIYKRGDFPSCRLVGNGRANHDAMMSTATQTNPATIEGIDLDAEVPCTGMSPDSPPCPNAADLMVRSHTHPGWTVCLWCWDHCDEYMGVCRATGMLEGRDSHCTIVQVLR